MVKLKYGKVVRLIKDTRISYLSVESQVYLKKTFEDKVEIWTYVVNPIKPRILQTEGWGSDNEKVLRHVANIL